MNRRSKCNVRSIALVLILCMFTPVLGLSLAVDRVGTLKGRLLDTDSKQPLPGADVFLVGTERVTVTNVRGEFGFESVPVGTYTVKFEYPEHMPMFKPDVVVRSQRITFITAELRLQPFHHEEVTVSAGYFSSPLEEVAAGQTGFSAEEVRRTAGSAGDISRIVTGLPSVAKVNDYHNGLAVRGGSPSENMFLVDNIEIPNINHFPIQGSSTGPISLLNVDFIKEVTFHSGGFSAMYGDKLSSVMDVELREGNRETFDIQLDFSLAGLGAVLEGPLGKSGSWLFSLRRSYVDLLVKLMDGTIAPTYSDLQGKVVIDLSPRSKLTFLAIGGLDDNEFSRQDSIDDGNIDYGNIHNREGTIGMNWLYIWGGSGYSETSLSYMYTRYENDMFDALTDALNLRNRSTESYINFRNVNNFTLGHGHRMLFGVEAKHLMNRYDYQVGERTDVSGNFRPGSAIRVDVNTYKAAGFFTYSIHPFSFLTLNLGLRGDYFAYNENFHLSPRGSVSLRLSGSTEMYAAAGIYYQNLPMLLLFQDPSYKELKDPRAFHYIVGIRHQFSADTRLTIEAYNKKYRDMPQDPALPRLFVMDAADYRDLYMERLGLQDRGRARSYGVEFTLQKKLKSKLYGMISSALFRTEYKDMEGTWRNRSYDNRFIFSFEGGYKPNRSWEFSARYIYAAGLPYTPFDLEATRAANTGIYDWERINEERLPDYHSLNIRLDRRFYFSASNLVCYLSLWNVYNRKNIAGYYWNTISETIDETKQFGFLPVLGIEFEF